MKIALAQTRPIPGNIQANLTVHEQFVRNAVVQNAEMVVFSELSLSGYEPSLAETLAILPTDPRLKKLKELSKQHAITIVVGAPVKVIHGTIISLLIFQPGFEIQIYGKHYLHPDEEPWFVPGTNLPPISINGQRVGLAICFELAIDEHFDNMIPMNPAVYVASVAKFRNGLDPAYKRLSTIAETGVHALFVNAVGPADNGVCAGGSAVWNKQGVLLAAMDQAEEGLLIFDTVTETVQR